MLEEQIASLMTTRRGGEPSNERAPSDDATKNLRKTRLSRAVTGERLIQELARREMVKPLAFMVTVAITTHVDLSHVHLLSPPPFGFLKFSRSHSAHLCVQQDSPFLSRTAASFRDFTQLLTLIPQ